jgi:hypothetical protein
MTEFLHPSLGGEWDWDEEDEDDLENYQTRPVSEVLAPGDNEVILWLTEARHVRAQPKFAVVLALTACEIYTRAVLNALIRINGLEAISTLIIPSEGQVCTLENSRVSKAIQIFTKKFPTQERWWQSWTDAYKLRNEVVHGGCAPDDTQMNNCFAACDSYIRFLAAVTDVARKHATTSYSAPF